MERNDHAQSNRIGRSNASIYRPIRLTSVVCKIIEIIVNHRLKWYLETNQLLIPQAGFRQI